MSDFLRSLRRGDRSSALERALSEVTFRDIQRHYGLDWVPLPNSNSPLRTDNKPSFSCWKNRDGRWMFKDHGLGDSGGLVEFIMRLRDCDRPEACRELITVWKSQCADVPLWHAMPIAEPVEPAAPDSPVPLALEGVEVPTDEELAVVANSRGWLSAGRPVITGLRFAADRQLIGCVTRSDRDGKVRVLVFWDGSRFNAQIRRLDGKRFGIWNREQRCWESGDGPKAKCLPGSCARWPIGAAGITNANLVMLVEGTGDFLAANAMIADADAARPGLAAKVAAVCMTGANNGIHPDALPTFSGKTVVVYPHVDASGAGEKGAKSWVRSLREAGAEVLVRDLRPHLPPGGKDLDDIHAFGLRNNTPLNFLISMEESAYVS